MVKPNESVVTLIRMVFAGEPWVWGIGIGILLLLAFLILAGKAARQISSWGVKLALFVVQVMGPILLLLAYLFFLDLWFDFVLSDSLRLIVLGSLIAIILFNEYAINPNNTSIHQFYRDRLSDAYLVWETETGEVEPKDDLKLSSLNEGEFQAPYHLINVALNLQGSKDPSLRGRNAENFFFSKRYTGSLRTGFCKTENMEKYDKHVNLGTVMAVSGAAASPNMGVFTRKPFVFLLTLLNVRLGYWLPNPNVVYARGRPGGTVDEDWIRRQKNRVRLFFGVGPRHLFLEAFGRLNEKRLSVNLSDGGHVENLGVYEVLRRRCKYIIAVDSEADPKMGFGGLLQLIRFARIDMGIEIKIDLEKLRIKQKQLKQSNKKKERHSRSHCTLGTIKYGKDEEGFLFYIKSSFTGDEHDYVRAYKNDNPDFPHEPTADQFFSETQFEVYRELGYHCADKHFETYFKKTKKKKDSDGDRQPFLTFEEFQGFFEEWKTIFVNESPESE